MIYRQWQASWNSNISFGGYEDTFVIGCVGRMSEEKNQQYLIHVFKSVLEIVPNSKLVLVGEGEKREDLELLSEKLGLSDRIIFTGNRTDVSSILNAFDIFVMPSIYEGFPIAGIEALSNGLPIVLSDTITRELEFTNKVAYVSLNASYENWAKVICSFKDERHASGQADLVIAQGFDIHSCTRKLEGYYQSV